MEVTTTHKSLHTWVTFWKLLLADWKQVELFYTTLVDLSIDETDENITKSIINAATNSIPKTYTFYTNATKATVEWKL